MKAITSLHVFAVLALAVAPNIVSGQDSINAVRRGRPEEASRNLSFWSYISFSLSGHCPPGPLGRHCREGSGSGGGGGSGSGSGSGSGNGNDSSNSSGSGDGNGTTSAATSSNGGGGSGGGSGSGSGSGSGGGGGGGGSAGSAVASWMGTSEGKISMVTLAALAASVAIAAMFMGSKRRQVKKDHALSGIIKKRIGLFERMASRGNCATCRPEDVKEAVLDSETEYRLA